PATWLGRDQGAGAVGGQPEERLRLGVVDGADERRASGFPLAAMTIRCLAPRHRAPSTERPDERRDVVREALARRAESHAAPPLDPAVRIHESAGEIP